jgi:hypothetical protein
VRNSIVAAIFALSRLSADPKMRIDKKPVTVKATDCPPQIVITVTPDNRYRAYVEAEQEPLCMSRQPFLDGARKLLVRGHDPRTMLVMRWDGAEEWALRGRLGVAADLTVDEHNGTLFGKWKPFSRSAGSARIAKSGHTVAARIRAGVRGFAIWWLHPQRDERT